MFTLVKVNKEYKEEALEFKKEFFDCNETVINGSALFDRLSFDDWMDLVKKNQNIETVSKDWAVSNVFFLMLNSKIIGITEIRHSLTTPFYKNMQGILDILYVILFEKRIWNKTFIFSYRLL